MNTISSDQDRAMCDNCGMLTLVDELDEVENMVDRVDPGGVVPHGQCPDCGSLAYAHGINHVDVSMDDNTIKALPCKIELDDGTHIECFLVPATDCPDHFYVVREQTDGLDETGGGDG